MGWVSSLRLGALRETRAPRSFARRSRTSSNPSEGLLSGVIVGRGLAAGLGAGGVPPKPWAAPTSKAETAPAGAGGIGGSPALGSVIFLSYSKLRAEVPKYSLT